MGGGRHDELACGEAARAVLQLIACVEQHGQALAYIRLDTDALDEHEPCLCTRLHLPHSTGRVGISEGVVLTSGHALEHLQLGKDVAPIRIPLLAPLRAFCASGAWTHMSVYSRRGGLVHGPCWAGIRGSHTIRRNLSTRLPLTELQNEQDW